MKEKRFHGIFQPHQLTAVLTESPCSVNFRPGVVRQDPIPLDAPHQPLAWEAERIEGRQVNRQEIGRKAVEGERKFGILLQATFHNRFIVAGHQGGIRFAVTDNPIDVKAIGYGVTVQSFVFEEVDEMKEGSLEDFRREFLFPCEELPLLGAFEKGKTATNGLLEGFAIQIIGKSRHPVPGNPLKKGPLHGFLRGG